MTTLREENRRGAPRDAIRGRAAADEEADRLVAPILLALRSVAAEVVGAELARLSNRLPELGDQAYAEITLTIRRVVDTLLAAPSTRIMEHAPAPGGVNYVTALRELFNLEPKVLEPVSRPVSLGTRDIPAHNAERIGR